MKGFLYISPQIAVILSFLRSSSMQSISLSVVYTDAPRWYCGSPEHGRKPAPITGTRRPKAPLVKCRARSTTMPLPVPPPMPNATKTIDGRPVLSMLSAKSRISVYSGRSPS